MIALAFVAGAVVGAPAGFLLAALLRSAAEGDRALRDMEFGGTDD